MPGLALVREGFCASCAAPAVLSQSPIPSRVRRSLASSSLGIVPQPHSSCPPALGPGGELAWRAAPAAPRPYVLRAVAAAPSPKSAGTSHYRARGPPKGQVRTLAMSRFH
ncbi:hypothetical protein CTheo_1936 [Ceratobasidium theobromae]|uniref:Uncharacterized protein n=1 Tax=Ceratobasidium theobromae TaxID=1582974 RepID=A0A5N5QSC9_9AGAM|nr:hypothetical protein CTheo_1936 [Ceratobasidium theobromae]